MCSIKAILLQTLLGFHDNFCGVKHPWKIITTCLYYNDYATHSYIILKKSLNIL